MSDGPTPRDGTRELYASVVIPARDAEGMIEQVVCAVLAQQRAGRRVEVIVVDDGSSDATATRARDAGARVLARPAGASGNPAAARNLGARSATGDPIVFLDADCLPAAGWLDALLRAHDRGAVIVGGSLALPAGLPASARCDYYCGWYLIHPRRPAGEVPHHPPPNLSVRRAAFLSTGGFTEQPPFEYTNEERAWQAELRRAGYCLYFEPAAVAYHFNRPGFRNLLRRNYRWAYTALESKSRTESARAAWLYRYPRALIAASVPLAFVHTAYILACWVRAGVFEPLLMLPAVLASRMAYVAGMSVGGARWLRQRGHAGAVPAPRWQ